MYARFELDPLIYLKTDYRVLTTEANVLGGYS